MQFDPNFGLVIISCALIAFEIMLIGFFVVGRARSRVFTKQFLKDNFDEEHRSYTHADIENTNGYPDMGNGRYSARLSYLDWLDFNKAQRVHYNFLEQVSSMITVTLLSGLYYPILASIGGFAFAFARLCYIFYLRPAGALNFMRILGALLGDISFLMNFVLSILAGVNCLLGGNWLEII